MQDTTRASATDETRQLRLLERRRRVPVLAMYREGIDRLAKADDE